ncbi:MAG TPA: prepilin-type N-terminal cleavage/methylation domain-containing protein [Opitutaceae bacterium]|nr:prepilin-type N-terminal cleavage/methylation domain-containing protein [Opitutaceae bacterium]
MRTAQRLHSGFTLIEVALASTILLVGFVGMIEALAVGSEMLDTARKQTIAAQIMEAEIEYLRLQSWPTIQGLTSKSADFLTNYPDFQQATLSGLASFAGTSFKFSRQLANPDPHSDVRQVTMTVSWTSITGKPHSRSSNVYICRYGLSASYQKS